MGSLRVVRRNQVDERRAGAIAALFGVLAALSGAEPTGSAPVDVLLLFVGVVAVTWASASAPWWALSGAAGVAAVIAFQPLFALVGLAAFGLGLYVGVTRRDHAELRAVTGGLALNVLLRSELEGFFGMTALIGIGVGVALFVLGVQRRKRYVRRPVVLAVIGAFALLMVGVISLLLAAAGARPDLERSTVVVDAGIAALNAGDYALAAEKFDEAADSFERVGERLGGPLAWPASLLPIVSQNISAGEDLSKGAAEALDTAAGALREVDPETLRVTGGRIDVEAIERVEAPLVEVLDALTELREITAEAGSPWLLGPVQDELDELEQEFDENEPRLENAIDAVRLAPSLLGADEPRRYIVLFSSPAEVRGIGGFVGAVAEIEIDDGRVELVDYQRSGDLNVFVQQNGARCDDCPDQFLERYGQFGFTSGVDGAVGSFPWSDMTMSAHFPDVAKVASVLYPQSGGREIDGVVLMDPYVVSTLMRYTGPVEVPELDVVVDSTNAADFLMLDQYVLADGKGVRIETLETLGRDAIGRILLADLPSPPDLAADLGPLVEQRRLLLWTEDPAEQDLFDRIGLLGAIPPIDPVDGGFSVSLTNGGNSKIDSFLRRTVETEIVEEADGTRSLVAEVTLTNSAPASGLPDYVIGNTLNFPDGTSRLFVSFYGPPELEEATRDGEPIELLPGLESGWNVSSEYVIIPSGGSVTYRVVFALPPGAPDGEAADPTIWTQPIVIDQSES